MAHLTLMDLASRNTPMAEEKKPKKWIAGATSGAHGQLRRKAEAAGETTREFAKAHDGDSGKTGAQARLAETLMGMNHGERRKKQLAGMYNHKSSAR